MNIASFLGSYPGIHMTQGFFHALIAAIIVDRALVSWEIRDPVVRQRFSLISVMLPIAAFPLYQLINPDRGSVSFRMEVALFDSNRWLSLDLLEKIPLSLLFIFILALTTALFICQEMIPIVRHTLEHKKSALHAARGDDYEVIKEALADLHLAKKPDIFMIEEDEPALFSTTGRNGAIFMTTGLMKVLTLEQMQVALAHEIAHIRKNKKPLLLVVFILRALMFFNPVVLIEFRRIVQEEEKICDDMAAALTRKPHVLAETLKKLYYKHEDTKLMQGKKLSDIKHSLSEYSHNMLIESRIMRLECGWTHTSGGEWFKFLLTLLVIAVINYYVI